MYDARARYRLAMIAPGTGGKCRYCGHHVDDLHEQVSAQSGYVFCKHCHAAGETCGGGEVLRKRAEERANGRRAR